MGHTVTLFEKDEKIGGILRFGIPDFKLEKKIIDRRMEQMAAEGVVFETGVRIGDDISSRYLLRMFDAVLITMGAGEPRDLPVDGRDLSGVHFAMEYLTQSNRRVAGILPKDAKQIVAAGKNVLVIGGGDTGSDCVGTANRQGAKKVYQFEIMPKPREWTEPTNPEWPYWPQMLRTSSSHEEGCDRQWNILTKKFTGKNVEWKSESGKPPKMVEVAGSEFSLDVDLVLLAMGFVHVSHNKLLEDLNVAFDDRGNVKVDKYATSAKGVFAAGDAGTGASLVVRAIFHGRQAAVAINEYLK
jgi:NADPH-dependent glutamate synthase beta subunit-like oxidoreductase